MNIELLSQRLSTFANVKFYGPVNEGEILSAERQLNFKFPPQYRDFLAVFGCGGVDTEDFIGLGGPDYLNIVKLMPKLQDRNNKLPNNLLPLRGDGFGNYDCLAFDVPTQNSEVAIVQWNHEGSSAQVMEVLANDFEQWFESILLMIEEDD